MKRLILSLTIALFGAVAVVPSTSVYAVDLFKNCSTANSEGCGVVKENNLNYQGKNSVWTIIQWVLGILGGIAVIMIVVGGIKYTVSGGDSAGIQSAKNTIMYAVIGLVVAMLASAIVLGITKFFV